MQSNLRWPARVVEVPGIPISAGAGTGTQDYVLVLRTDQLPLCLGPVTFEIFPEVNSSTGTIRFSARQYCATLFARRP